MLLTKAKFLCYVIYDENVDNASSNVVTNYNHDAEDLLEIHSEKDD